MPWLDVAVPPNSAGAGVAAVPCAKLVGRGSTGSCGVSGSSTAAGGCAICGVASRPDDGADDGILADGGDDLDRGSEDDLAAGAIDTCNGLGVLEVDEGCGGHLSRYG